MKHLESEKSAFVFIYGSWQQPDCWSSVQADLESQGYKTYAPDMPTDEIGSNFDREAECVAETIREEDEPIIVGWSRGGNIAVRVAELIPVKKVVFVAASFEPETIDCLLSEQDRQEMPPRNNPVFTKDQAIIDRGDGLSEIKPDFARDLIYHDCPSRDTETAVSGLRPHRRFTPEPILDNWPLRPDQQAYVIPRKDRVVRPEWQEFIARHILKTNPYYTNTGHAPMLAEHRELSDILIQIDNETRPSTSVALRQRTDATTSLLSMSV